MSTKIFIPLRGLTEQYVLSIEAERDRLRAVNGQLLELLYKAKLNANSDLHVEKSMATSETKLAILTYLSSTLDALWSEAEAIAEAQKATGGQ